MYIALFHPVYITLIILLIHNYSSDVLYDSYGFRHDDELHTMQPEETLDSVVRRLDQQAQQKDVSTIVIYYYDMV